MENTNEELRAHLMATDAEFRLLADRHASYHHELEALEAKTPISERDEEEEHRIKKLKLHLKDQMNELIAKHLKQEQVA